MPPSEASAKLHTVSQMDISTDDLKALAPSAFEQLIAQMLVASGFRNVVALAGSGDEGIDLRAEWLEELPTGDSRMTLWAVQCKRYANALSQEHIQKILNAMLQPPTDLLPARPDFFLIATSATLSVNSRRLVERANNDRTRYGCTFVVWDGDLISRKLALHADVAERFFKTDAPPPLGHAVPIVRLSVIVDRVGDRVLLTFLCDLDEAGPTCQMERSELNEQQFNALLEQARSLAHLAYSFADDRVQRLESVGAMIANLIPAELQNALFAMESGYVRLASNMHDIPLELAYHNGRFLGDSLRIGRIQISDTVQPSPQWTIPSALLIGPSTYELPFTEREIYELSALLSSSGIPVTTLVGDLATRESLGKLLDQKDYSIIHFSGHGAPDFEGENVVELTDARLPLREMLLRPVSGSLIFLSACGSGNQMNDTSQQFFARGASAVVGFVGPVTDQAATWIAVRFYDALRSGECLGDALHLARAYQREKLPDDFSWVSLVLFGDPTARLAEGKK